MNNLDLQHQNISLEKSSVSVVFCLGEMYYGYTNDSGDRGWVEDISKAIFWKKDIPGPEVIYCPNKELRNLLDKSKKKKVLRKVQYIIE